MPKDMITIYKEFFDQYSEKYGQNICILLLVGKFYELYASYKDELTPVAESVRKSSELMNILLKEIPLPKGYTKLWSGIPEQSLHKFAQTLTREGWTVVIVDQVKNKSDVVIDRIPTRVLSPGTHVEIATQERLSVASLFIQNNFYSTSLVDLTTGETFSFYTDKPDLVLHMYQIYCVKELIYTCFPFQSESEIRAIFTISGPVHYKPFETLTILNDSFKREEYLRKMFQIKSLTPVKQFLHLEQNQIPLEKSLCLLLVFLDDHFPQQIGRFTNHTIYCPDHFMRLSNNILEQLNMITSNRQKSVLQLVDRTHSALGKRVLRERILRPITDEAELELRWQQVDFILQGKANKNLLEKFLKGLYDMPRLHYHFCEGKLQTTDVLQLFHTYQASSCLIKELQNTPLSCNSDLAEQIKTFRTHFNTLFDEEKGNQRLNNDFVGFLTPIAGPETAMIEIQIKNHIQAWKTLWASFCSEAKIQPESFILEQKGDEDWVWEGPRNSVKSINSTKTNLLKNIQIDSRSSGPIRFSCSEFETFLTILKSLWSKLQKSLKQETTVVCDDLWNSVKLFHEDWVSWLGMVDCTLSLASVSQSLGWTKPSLGTHLKIEGLRHPLLETSQTRMEYVKHDISLQGGWLIYGVNASGKSSLMKAVGISVLLAQAGSFVPATSFVLRPYDAAFSRIWNQDNLWAGLSSFAVEVTELRDILKNATKNSLVLGDEVCSGTESSSATALVAATLEHLHSLGAHFMFATHLHDLLKVTSTQLKEISVWHLRVDRTPEGKLIYDRRLQPGPGSCSYGLEVARAMGIPLTLMDRALEIRRSLEGTANILEAPKSIWNSKIQRQMCEVCKNPIINQLEVHHIQERANDGSNELRNLVVLCERCHDKHHNGEIEVGSLQQTSDGLQRSVTESVTSIKIKTNEKNKISKYSEEEIQIIETIIQKHKGRPLTRMILELAEEGIIITPAQLKKFIA